MTSPRSKADLAAQAAKDLANALNSYSNGLEIEVFCETILKQHRTLQQSVFECLVKMISVWALLPENAYDGRNEFTVAMCKKLRRLLVDEMVLMPNLKDKEKGGLAGTDRTCVPLVC